MDDIQIISLLRNILNKGSKDNYITLDSDEKKALMIAIERLSSFQDDLR